MEKSLNTRRRRGSDPLLIWVTAGQTIGSCAGRKFEAGPGDLVLFDQGESQDYTAMGGEPWTWWWVHGSGSLVDQLISTCRAMANGSPVVRLGEDARIRRVFEGLVRDGAELDRSLDQQRVADAQFAMLLSLILQRLATPKRFGAGFDAEALERFIERHLDRPVTLDELAGQMHWSVPHFTRRFRQAYGQSPMQYVTARRVDKASLLLSETTLSIAEIAGAVGYEDVFYFSRVFKKVAGVAPTAYRESAGA